MKNRMLLLWNLPVVFGRALSHGLATVINRRSRQYSDHERARVLRRAEFRVAVNLFLLLILCGSQIGLAKPDGTIETLTAQYSLNKRVEDLDGTQIRRKLLKLLSRPVVRLFLEVVQRAEGGEPNIMVGGCRADNLKQHPAITLPSRCWYRIWLSGRWAYSTASGNYQITFTNWKRLAPFLGLQDFSETSQALAALELIRRGGGAANSVTPKGLALKGRIQKGFLALLQGDINTALCLATYDWASSTCSSLPAAGKIDYTHLALTVASKYKRSLRNSLKRPI